MRPRPTIAICIGTVLSHGSRRERVRVCRRADPHHVAREAFMEVDGMVVPSPSPRFSRTPAVAGRSSVKPGEGAREALSDWGLGEEEIASFPQPR